MADQVRTRFAPSPTGFMHVGNLRTALYAWLLARSRQGKFILRIEDTDRARYVENAVDVIYATLRSAGLDHDEGPDRDGGFGPYVQSERREIYRKYAEELVARNGAYYCFCDKREEEESEENPHAGGCPGHCGDLPAGEVARRLASGATAVIRQRVPRDGATTFTDCVFGEITIENKVLDDQILLKSDGMPTYNFANVIDDHLMQISYVVRGSEYLSSTPKYNMLYRAFGWEIPQYVHLPLIMGRDADGNVSKLSKRHGSVSFENLVSEGYLPEAVVNYIALLGWSPKSDREIFSLAELAEVFRLSGLNKSSAVFDYEKLRWMNSEYIKSMTPEKFAAVARPFAQIDGTALESSWQQIARLLQPRTELLSEIPEKIAFLRALPDYPPELFDNKKSKCDPATARAILDETLPQFRSPEKLSAETVNTIAARYAEKHQVKLGQPMWAIRIALAGQAVTPGGAGEIGEILGKEEALRRIETARAKLQ
ncbi:MAG: glutamate--tRNA ligase [Victivallaceae bacterium]|nr:glutamate--tRNA ligase [Victivallaceae bacterium]